MIYSFPLIVINTLMLDRGYNIADIDREDHPKYSYVLFCFNPICDRYHRYMYIMFDCTNPNEVNNLSRSLASYPFLPCFEKCQDKCTFQLRRAARDPNETYVFRCTLTYTHCVRRTYTLNFIYSISGKHSVEGL